MGEQFKWDDTKREVIAFMGDSVKTTTFTFNKIPYPHEECTGTATGRIQCSVPNVSGSPQHNPKDLGPYALYSGREAVTSPVTERELSQIEELTKEIKVAKASLEHWDKLSKLIEKKAVKIVNENCRLNQKIHELEAQLIQKAVNNPDAMRLKAENSKLVQQLASLRSLEDKWRAKYNNDVQLERDTASRVYKVYTEQNREKDRLLTQKQVDVASLENRIKVQKSNLEALGKEVVAITNRSDQSAQLYAQRERQITYLESRVNSLEAEKRVLAENMVTREVHTNAVRFVESEKAELSKKITLLEEEIEFLKKSEDTKQCECPETCGCEWLCRCEGTSQSTTEMNLERKVEEQNGIIGAKQSMINDLKIELNKLQKAKPVVPIKKAEYASNQDELIRIAMENRMLKSQLSSKSEIIRGLQSQKAK